jgi:hypothetical protein
MNQVLKKLRWKTRKQRDFVKNLKFNIQYKIISKFNVDVIEEYCIDNEILRDYYNEEPDHDYYHDRD